MGKEKYEFVKLEDKDDLLVVIVNSKSLGTFQRESVKSKLAQKHGAKKEIIGYRQKGSYVFGTRVPLDAERLDQYLDSQEWHTSEMDL